MSEAVIVSDYAGEAFGKKIANMLEWNYVPVESRYFNDGELDIQVKDNIRGRDAFYICPYFPDPVRRHTEIQLINSALKYSSARRVIDVPTYLGFMKKDWKDRPRVPISIREVAVMMEQYANKVITLDMHSDQIQGMFRIPLDHLDGSVLFASDIKKNYELDKIMICSPDSGGGKRAKRLTERLGGKEYAMVYKIRDVQTGDVIAVNVMGNVEGKRAIFIDDQGVTLKSLSEAANKVLEYGAIGADAYVTHGLMVSDDGGVKAEDRLAQSQLRKLIFTDTIPRDKSYFDSNPKIRCLSSIPLVGASIERDHYNKSLSRLFETEKITWDD